MDIDYLAANKNINRILTTFDHTFTGNAYFNAMIKCIVLLLSRMTQQHNYMKKILQYPNKYIN